jgi:hypothetical protein
MKPSTRIMLHASLLLFALIASAVALGIGVGVALVR